MLEYGAYVFQWRCKLYIYQYSLFVKDRVEENVITLLALSMSPVSLIGFEPIPILTFIL